MLLSFHVSDRHSHIPFLCLDGLGSSPVYSGTKNTFYDYLAFSSLEFYHSGLQTPDVISFSAHQQCLPRNLSPSSSCSLSCCIPRAPSTIGVCKNMEIRTIEPYTIELHQYNRFAWGVFLISNHPFPSRNLPSFILNSLCFVFSLAMLSREVAIQQDTRHLNSQLQETAKEQSSLKAIVCLIVISYFHPTVMTHLNTYLLWLLNSSYYLLSTNNILVLFMVLLFLSYRLVLVLT